MGTATGSGRPSGGRARQGPSELGRPAARRARAVTVTVSESNPGTPSQEMKWIFGSSGSIEDVCLYLSVIFYGQYLHQFRTVITSLMRLQLNRFHCQEYVKKVSNVCNKSLLMLE